MKASKATATACAAALTGLLLLVPGVLWKTYVVTTVYAWYAPSGWPTLTIRGAVCLSVVSALIINRYRKDESYTPFDVASIMFLVPACILFQAWLFRAVTMMLGWWPS